MEKSDESRTRRDEQRRKYSKVDKRANVSWLGHLERMQEDRRPKKIFTQELEGTRRKGRPGKRWEEEVERDRSSTGSEKMWHIGKKWNDIVRQAKAHSGL